MLPAVKVEHLWKEYVVGQSHDRHATFYDTLSNALKTPFRKRDETLADPTKFWALNDVSFEVQPGEVVGIIGRNGAGKSTLLKVLSRITAPTKGRVEVRGRLASLLEVGTGFHGELSGRENIFLNGAILGMSRKDIAKKFDEIVAFAEVEKFIDTPVKRYSSGMYVRLAFAVAAYLEPDILIVDEVLAVGDLAFQKKCLGKMGDVAALGRTVIFVSHNMQAVRLLCSKVFALSAGKLIDQGETEGVVNRYATLALPGDGSSWDGPPLGDETVQLRAMRLKNKEGALVGTTIRSSENLVVEIVVNVSRAIEHLCVGFDLFDSEGVCVFRAYQTDRSNTASATIGPGPYCVQCFVPQGVLNSGIYSLAPRIGIHNKAWIVNADALISLECELTHGETEYWSSLSSGSRPGSVAPLFDWRVVALTDSSAR